MGDLRIVFKGADTNYKMDLLAWQQNWEFYDFQPKNEMRMYKAWRTRDGETTIQYMEDYYACIHYLTIVGKDGDEIAQKIRSTFDSYTLDELLGRAALARDKRECIGVIIALAAASPKLFEPEIFSVFERMFSHESPEVREATCFATTYRAWPEFKKPLERLIENDPDLEMREYAQATLRSLMKHCWQEQV